MQCIRLNHEINKMCSDVPFPRDCVAHRNTFCTYSPGEERDRAGTVVAATVPVLWPTVRHHASSRPKFGCNVVFQSVTSEDCMVLHSPEFCCFRWGQIYRRVNKPN